MLQQEIAGEAEHTGLASDDDFIALVNDLRSEDKNERESGLRTKDSQPAFSFQFCLQMLLRMADHRHPEAFENHRHCRSHTPE